MSPPKTDFPPIRACIFDMDGLLLNTEDIYTLCANNVLSEHGRPPLPWSLKARLMGVPGSSTGDVFHAWAQLPIPREQFAREQLTQQGLHFPDCAPLPGATKLLADLKRAKGVELALASTLHGSSYRVFVEAEPTMEFCWGGHVGFLGAERGEQMDWGELRW